MDDYDDDDNFDMRYLSHYIRTFVFAFLLSYFRAFVTMFEFSLSNFRLFTYCTFVISSLHSRISVYSCFNQ